MTTACKSCGGLRSDSAVIEYTSNIPPELCECLTFAEAMALYPSEVEFQLTGCQGWSPMRLAGDVKLESLREGKFRRSRPKRSRVQEMAEARFSSLLPTEKGFYEQGAVEAIRAVCEYLRDTGDRNCSHADYVERHFLEPR